MSLTTREQLSRQSWIELPMDNDGIAAVEAMVFPEGQHILRRDGPLLEWRPGVPLNSGDANMDRDPPLNDNVDNYELEPPHKAEIEDYG